MARAIDWTRYDTLKAQGLSERAIAGTEIQGQVAREGRFARQRMEEEGGRLLMRTITLDTNVADCPEVIEAAQRRGLEIAVLSVTDREMRLSDYRPGVDARILETLVLGENEFGKMVLGSEIEPDLFEQLLHIISNGSFPKPGSRDDLTPPQRRQLRDAMILLAHVRGRRDIFVSDDIRAFLGHGRRDKLES